VWWQRTVTPRHPTLRWLPATTSHAQLRFPSEQPPAAMQWKAGTSPVPKVKERFVEIDTTPMWVMVVDRNGEFFEVNVNDPRTAEENQKYVREAWGRTRWSQGLAAGATEEDPFRRWASARNGPGAALPGDRAFAHHARDYGGDPERSFECPVETEPVRRKAIEPAATWTTTLRHSRT